MDQEKKASIASRRGSWSRRDAETDPPTLPAAADESLAGIPDLVAEFVSYGLSVRYADRTNGHDVAPNIQRVAYRVARTGMQAAHRQDAPGRTLYVRVRIEGDHLVVSTQTSQAVTDAPISRPDERSRAAVRAIVDSAGGRVHMRQTSGGNTLVIIRFPL